MKRNVLKLLLPCVIIIIAFVVRVVQLGEIPAGLTNDEADIGYDAYSLLITGRDQWGQYLPLTSFKGFGDYRLPLYTYLVVPVIKIFDLSAFSVRFPSAMFGVFSVVLLYFAAKKLFEKQKNSEIIAVASMFFMALSPWALGLSRLGIESNVAITFFLLGLLLFLYYKNGKKYVVLSFISFALTLYTYTSFTFITPISIIVLCLFSWKEMLKIRKTLFAGIVLFILLISPLFLLRSAAGVRVSQVSFMSGASSIGILTNLDERLSSCREEIPFAVCRVLENKPVVFAQTFLTNYLSHLSFSFLFVHGTATQYSILPRIGLFYSIELAFLLLGLVGFIKMRVRIGSLVVIFLLLSIIPDSITGDGHYSRASSMMPFMYLIEGFGVFYLWEILGVFKKLKVLVLMCAIFITGFLVASFISSYFTYFPKHYSTYSQFGYGLLTEKIEAVGKKYDRIYLSRYANDTKQYIYYLFYTKYPPSLYQKQTNVVLSDQNGWVSVDKFQNIYYVDALPKGEELEEISGDVLLISHPSEFPKDFVFLDEVKNKKGDVQFAFTDKEMLLKYHEEHGLNQVK